MLLLTFHGVVMDILCNYTIDVNFSCICAVIVNRICHNIVKVVDPQLLGQCYDEIHDQQQDRRVENIRLFIQ